MKKLIPIFVIIAFLSTFLVVIKNNTKKKNTPN